MENSQIDEYKIDNDKIQIPSSGNQLTSNLAISKNQMKKMKREEAWENKKSKYKQHKKELKKQKQLKKREEQENLKQINPEMYNQLYPHVINPPKKEIQKQYLEKIEEGIKIIIDCGFEKFMKEKELRSLTKQITSCYSTNKKAGTPFNMIVYDVGPTLKNFLLINNCDKWLGFKYIEEGLYGSVKDFINTEFAKCQSKDLKLEEGENGKSSNAKGFLEKIIYLTGDSENEINSIEKDKIYIIGGLIDRNKLKNITYDKANDLNVSHARLPIGDYLNLKSSKILATNHVFAILSDFLNKTGDWKESFMNIIPTRKFDKKDDENESNDSN